MQKILFLALLFLTSKGIVSAQCIDSSRISPYWECFDGFNPVCGCDLKNYRSECAAYHWGGVNTYVSGVCDNFEIDFVPNPVVNYPGNYMVFVKNPATVTVQIYDTFGKNMYTMNHYTTYANQMIGPVQVDFSIARQGIYVFVVSVMGERKYRKILHVVE